MTEPLFTFEASVYYTDEAPKFELMMRFRGRQSIWSADTPVNFRFQYDTDDPYEPSTPLTPDDLTWALLRAGWRIVGDWDSDVTDPGYLSAEVTPTPLAQPEVYLSASVLAALA
jgi:hypothetical protein